MGIESSINPDHLNAEKSPKYDDASASAAPENQESSIASLTEKEISPAEFVGKLERVSEIKTIYQQELLDIYYESGYFFDDPEEPTKLRVSPGLVTPQMREKELQAALRMRTKITEFFGDSPQLAQSLENLDALLGIKTQFQEGSAGDDVFTLQNRSYAMLKASSWNYPYKNLVSEEDLSNADTYIPNNNAAVSREILAKYNVPDDPDVYFFEQPYGLVFVTDSAHLQSLYKRFTKRENISSVIAGFQISLFSEVGSNVFTAGEMSDGDLVISKANFMHEMRHVFDKGVFAPILKERVEEVKYRGKGGIMLPQGKVSLTTELLARKAVGESNESILSRLQKSTDVYPYLNKHTPEDPEHSTPIQEDPLLSGALNAFTELVDYYEKTLPDNETATMFVSNMVDGYPPEDWPALRDAITNYSEMHDKKSVDSVVRATGKTSDSAKGIDISSKPRGLTGAHWQN